MSDPAADAALLALVRMTGKAWNRGQALETAAREALAPIRELHKARTEPIWWHKLHESDSDTWTFCEGCRTVWPCDTARLCYTTDELKPKGIQ